MKKLAIMLALGAAVLAGCGKSGVEPGGATPTTLPASGAIRNGAGEGTLISISRTVSPSILIEAESGAITPPVEIKDDKDASGGKYIVAPEGPEHKEISIGGDSTCKLRVSEPGDYTLWLRANWSGACGNSIDIRLDGERLGTVEDSVFEVWHWVALQRPLRGLAAGEHLLTLYNREDGSAVDQVLLTQDSGYRPAEIEPAEAPGRQKQD